jgi:hypothetical protein
MRAVEPSYVDAFRRCAAAARRRKNAAHGASRGQTEVRESQAPEGRKKCSPVWTSITRLGKTIRKRPVRLRVYRPLSSEMRFLVRGTMGNSGVFGV